MLHDGEFAIDDQLVRGLIADQFPQWADLPLRRVVSSGTVNVIYRLGTDMAVRLPRMSDFSSGPQREATWLPMFAPLLPLSIPEYVALGQPTDAYPSPWSVLGWIEGENATPATLTNLNDAARQLGEFVVALRGIDTEGAPDGNYRGHGLQGRDTLTRDTIDSVADEFDTGELIQAWDSAFAAPPWSEDPRWFHGDLHPGNLLARDGRLSAAIDFEGCSVGDPSSDLIAGWWLFDTESRDMFRQTVRADTASWERGRGWALSVALVAQPYYAETNPVFADMARQAIRRVLDDQ